MCSIETHERNYPTGNDDASSGGGRQILPDSTKGALVSLFLTLNLIESWLQQLKKNYLHRTIIYFEKMSDLFNKISVTIPKPKPDDKK